VTAFRICQIRDAIKELLTPQHIGNLHSMNRGNAETEAQSQLLQSLHCNEVQGFLFGTPMPREDFETQYLTRASAPGALPRQPAARLDWTGSDASQKRRQERSNV